MKNAADVRLVAKKLKPYPPTVNQPHASKREQKMLRRITTRKMLHHFLHNPSTLNHHQLLFLHHL